MDIIAEENVVLVEGHIQASEIEEPKILVDSISLLKDYEDELKSVKKLYLSLRSKDSNLLNSVKAELVKYSGDVPVIFYFEDEKKAYATEKKYWIDENRAEDLRSGLKAYIGDGNKFILR